MEMILEVLGVIILTGTAIITTVFTTYILCSVVFSIIDEIREVR